MDLKKFYTSFGFLNESVTLNEIEELEKDSLPTAAFKENTDNMFSSELEKTLVFDYGYTIKLLLTN